jgi:NAD+ diphosphatase
VPFCEKCNQYRFPVYNVAVSMIVVNEQNGKIMLLQHYGKPAYILVAGYINRGEQSEKRCCKSNKRGNRYDGFAYKI